MHTHTRMHTHMHTQRTLTHKHTHARMCVHICIHSNIYIQQYWFPAAVEPQFIAKVDQQRSKQLATGGGLYSQYTTGDRHETYHLNQPTTGTMPLSQSPKLNSTSETPSSNYPLLLGRQSPEKKPFATASTASRSSSSKEHKRHFPENIGASSVPVRGPDAVYNMSASLNTRGDGEIEVTSVRKSKGKKKKGKKKKKTNPDPDTVTKQVGYSLSHGFNIHSHMCSIHIVFKCGYNI